MHIVKYEDLSESPEPISKGALEFLLDVEDISGTKLERHLQLATDEMIKTKVRITKKKQFDKKGFEHTKKVCE